MNSVTTKTPNNDPHWLALLNLAGLNIAGAVSPMLFDRLGRLPCVAASTGEMLSDVAAFAIVFWILLTAILVACREHRLVKVQVAWLEKCSWPFWTGMAIAGVYLALLTSTSPFFAGFVALRPR